VAIDATPTEENRSALNRTEQLDRLTGATVYVLHVARAHIVPGDITIHGQATAAAVERRPFAYAAAGFRPSRPNASKLQHSHNILERVRGLRRPNPQPGCVAVEAAPRGFPDPAGGRGRRPQCTREKI